MLIKSFVWFFGDVAVAVAVVVCLCSLLDSFSYNDGDGGDDAGKKMILYFTFECRNSVNLLSTPIGSKNYNARAQLLFCSLILLFSDVAAAVGVVIFLILN